MNRDVTGTYRITTTVSEKVRAFIPSPLPPVPPLEIGGARQLLLERATLHYLSVDRLDFRPTAPRDSYWWPEGSAPPSK